MEQAAAITAAARGTSLAPSPRMRVCPDCPIGAEARQRVMADPWLPLLAAMAPFVVAIAVALLVAALLDRAARAPGGS